MPKLRKQRRRKVYRHNVNRKRLRNKIFDAGKIECQEVKNAWEKQKSVQTNLKQMGLSYDPNQTIKIPNKKKELICLGGGTENWDRTSVEEPIVLSKSYVAESLENDAKAPRERRFNLPKGQLERLSYLMKAYGNDYKAMERDKKNYNQETWKQIRQKIKRFISIAEKNNKYLDGIDLSLYEFSNSVSDDEM
nr:nucleolar protein 16 [Leptinotarsa decemlineata]